MKRSACSAEPAHDLGVGRTYAGHRDAGGEVDDVVAVDVDDDPAAGVVDEDRHRHAEPVGELFAAKLLKLLRLGSGDSCDQLASLLGV